MKARLAILLQYGCLAVGAVLVSVVAFARLDGDAGRAAALESFAASAAQPDQTLWSPERIRDYQASLKTVTDVPVAVLRVPELHLEVPVFATDTELHLNRGAGLIAGMGLPDTGGNVGIAGHRDGYFRVLKDVHVGDTIDVQTLASTTHYRVTDISIVAPTDVHVLDSTDIATLTLVTCYPFYFIGEAPKRYIVKGVAERVVASAR